MTTHVDTIVIGGGMAGLPFALRAAKHGPTVLFEGDLLGGTCLNRGCIPTKTMLHSAKVAHMARRAEDFGVHVGPVTVDMGAIVDRKNGVVESVRSGSYRAAAKADQLTLVEAWARFVGPRTVEAGDEAYVADRVVINVGARPHVPDVPGIDEVPWLDSTSALDLRDVPGHLVVAGGGYVGCEFAQMFRRFGADVTIVGRADRLLPGEDPDVSEVIEGAFKAEGIDVRTSTPIRRLEHSGDETAVVLGDDRIPASQVLIATGREPNTTSLGLDRTGVGVDQRGFIEVGSDYATSADGVFAIGDVTGPPMFTHSARDDAALLYRQLFHGEDASAPASLTPHAVFTDPEVAAFGLSEAQARKAHGEGVSVGTVSFRSVAKAKAIGETDGFVKIIAGPDRSILGATIVGPDAGNLIAELVVAATAGTPVDTIRSAIHIHPTLSEAVNAAAGGVHRPATD